MNPMKEVSLKICIMMNNRLKYEYYGESDSDSQDYDEERDENVMSTLNFTMIFVIIAMIGSILGIIAAFLVGTGKIDNKIGAGLAVIGILFAFITPMYLMVQLPGAIEEDSRLEDSEEDGPWNSFFGSTTEVRDDVEFSWGPSIAWYLTLIAGIMNIGGLALVSTSKSSNDVEYFKPYYQPPQQQYPHQFDQESYQQPQQKTYQRRPSKPSPKEASFQSESPYKRESPDRVPPPNKPSVPKRPPEDEIHCPDCGASNKPDHKYCWKCGKRMDLY